VDMMLEFIIEIDITSQREDFPARYRDIPRQSASWRTRIAAAANLLALLWRSYLNAVRQGLTSLRDFILRVLKCGDAADSDANTYYSESPPVNPTLPFTNASLDQWIDGWEPIYVSKLSEYFASL